MPKNRFQIAKEFLEELKKDKIIWKFEDFKLEIEKNIGSDKYRTVKPYISLMIGTALISAEGENVRIN